MTNLTKEYLFPLPEGAHEVVGKVVGSRKIISELLRAREAHEQGSHNFSGLSETTSSAVNDVFGCYAPLLERRSRAKLSSLRQLLPDDVADIVQEQQIGFYNGLIFRFRWSEYVGDEGQSASWALVNYSLRFAKPGLAVKYLNIRRHEPLTETPEDYQQGNIDSDDDESQVRQVLDRWRRLTDNTISSTIIRRYIEGKSVSQISAEDHVGVRLVATRIAQGKLALIQFLQDRGCPIPTDLLMLNNSGVLGNKPEITKIRANFLLRKLPRWKPFLPAASLSAAELFCGATGSRPLSYEETAKALGISVSTCHQRIEKALRIIVGTENPEPRALELHERQIFFQFWKNNKEVLNFDEVETKILVLSMDDDMPSKQIGKITQLDPRQVRRIREKLFRIIESAMASVTS